MNSKILLAALICLVISSCKVALYSGNAGQLNQTQVQLTQNNFKVLGSFTGTATVKKKLLSIKDRVGVVTEAKTDMLTNAKKEGVYLTGSRALVNVTTDVIEVKKKITVTYSAEIIEFTGN